MIKLYKYGFWFLIIATFTMFNYGRLYKNKAENDIKLIQRINKKRIASLFISNTILKREIKAVSGIDIITGVQKENLFKDTVIAVLLSDFKCDRCQLNELERLLRIEKKLKSKNIEIIGITTKDKMNIIIAQRKIIHIDFPIYYVDDRDFYNKISFSKDFPQIIFVSNGVVLSSFNPIPKDDKFSIKYYNKLIPLIENSF